MGKKTEKSEQNNDDDQIAFRHAMRGVKPLKASTKVTLRSPVLERKKLKPQQDTSETMENPFSDYETLTPVSSEDLLAFARPGIQDKILRNLRNGQYNVEAILDLHGMTVSEARTSLYHFLLKCEQKNIRHVLIIHGKGRSGSPPILKNKVNHWLRQTEKVLAFCSANTRDGRSGSVYVLLKIKRR